MRLNRNKIIFAWILLLTICQIFERRSCNGISHFCLSCDGELDADSDLFGKR